LQNCQWGERSFTDLPRYSTASDPESAADPTRESAD
jgi:hypothetical protein